FLVRNHRPRDRWPPKRRLILLIPNVQPRQGAFARRQQEVGIPAHVRTVADSKGGEAQLALDREEERSFDDLLGDVLAALVARDLPQAEVKSVPRCCVANPQRSLRLSPKASNEEEPKGDRACQRRKDDDHLPHDAEPFPRACEGLPQRAAPPCS